MLFKTIKLYDLNCLIISYIFNFWLRKFKVSRCKVRSIFKEFLNLSKIDRTFVFSTMLMLSKSYVSHLTSRKLVLLFPMLFPRKYHERATRLNGDGYWLLLWCTQNILIKGSRAIKKYRQNGTRIEIAAIKIDITTELALSQSGKLESF